MQEDETIQNIRKKLIFRSGHRGTKEMDMLMGSFAEKYVPNFTEDELKTYEELLQENDPNLYNWIIGKEDAPDKIQSEIFTRLKNHRYAQG